MRARNIADVKRFIQFVTQVAARAADKGEITSNDLLPPVAPANSGGPEALAQSVAPAASSTRPAVAAADDDSWVS